MVRGESLTAVVGPVRVVIADDDPLVRTSLAMILDGTDDLSVVAEAADGHEAIDVVRRGGVDVVLMDIRMPVTSGLEATRHLMADPRPPTIIILTTFGADEYVLDAVSAGAAGFLLKDTPPDDIVAAVRRAARGESTMSPAAVEAMMRQIRDETSGADASDAAARLDRLTDRERQVAEAVAAGHTNAEIAEDLHMSISTVKAHVSKLFEKLEVTNRVQIAIVVIDATSTRSSAQPQDYTA